MEARKRAMQKRKKLRTLGKSRSTESEDEENEEEEGKQINIEKGTSQLYRGAGTYGDMSQPYFGTKPYKHLIFFE